MIQPCFSKAVLIHERKDIWNTFCGPSPALEGSIAAQGKGLDPGFDVSGAPADTATANVYGMRKGTPADTTPDRRPAANAGEAHDLMAGK